MGRSPCCDKLGLKKGPWTPEEDQKLLAYIEEHGHGNWRALPTKAGLQRCGKSCRLRWTNYLRPDIKRGKFSLQEEQTIIQLHALLGNRWSAIATHLPKRTDNEIKNYWNTHLKKRLTKMGIDPVTHKPKNDALVSAAEGGGVPQSKNAANLSHMAQWESARLEAEARLVRQSKIRSTSNSNNTATANNSSFGSPLSPDIHISDHHQIVPTMSPTHHYLSMTTTTSGVATVSTTTPRCLDVLKAWHGEWSSTSTGTGTSTSATNNNNNNNNNNNDGVLGIGMGLTGLSGGVGLGIESPTSTLSFSENAQPVVPTMGTGSVIEFMGHQEDQHHHHQELMVKEEGDHHHHHHVDQWKREYHNNNEIEINNSLSFSPSPPLFHDLNGDKEAAIDDDNGHGHGQGFMEGFTELLLSTKTSDHKIVLQQVEEGNNNDDDNNNNNHQNIDANSSANKSGSTSRSSDESDYFEDNKTYWNSILNLVNSSPSHSPMF